MTPPVRTRGMSSRSIQSQSIFACINLPADFPNPVHSMEYACIPIHIRADVTTSTMLAILKKRRSFVFSIGSMMFTPCAVRCLYLQDTQADEKILNFPLLIDLTSCENTACFPFPNCGK